MNLDQQSARDSRRYRAQCSEAARKRERRDAADQLRAGVALLNRIEWLRTLAPAVADQSSPDAPDESAAATRFAHETSQTTPGPRLMYTPVPVGRGPRLGQGRRRRRARPGVWVITPSNTNRLRAVGHRARATARWGSTPAVSPFVFTDLPEPTFAGLPACCGRAARRFRQRVDRCVDGAMRASREAAITSLDRLAYMGKRGWARWSSGPARGPKAPESPTALEMSELVESARRAVAGGARYRIAHAEAALAQIIQVGTSAGGARAKAVRRVESEDPRDPGRTIRCRRRFRALADQVRRRRPRRASSATVATTAASSTPIT